jgi:cell division protein FtsB
MIAKNGKNKKSKHASWFPLIIALTLAASVFLAISNWNIMQKRNELKSRIAALAGEIAILEQKNSQLKEGITQSQGEEYAERIAREDLGMKKSGEEVLVVKPASTTAQETNEVKEKNFWQKILEKLGF